MGSMQRRAVPWPKTKLLLIQQPQLVYCPETTSELNLLIDFSNYTK
jgi:hypothetical protein